jgi:hypothetical protein
MGVLLSLSLRALKEIQLCLGCDFASESPIYLALIVSDWDGKSRHLKNELFRCFRERDYEYNEAKSEVKFKQSGITLHIGDIVRNAQDIRRKDPQRLFQGHKGGLQMTAVLHYGDNQGKTHTHRAQDLGPSCCRIYVAVAMAQARLRSRGH